MEWDQSFNYTPTSPYLPAYHVLPQQQVRKVNESAWHVLPQVREANESASPGAGVLTLCRQVPNSEHSKRKAVIAAVTAAEADAAAEATAAAAEVIAAAATAAEADEEAEDEEAADAAAAATAAEALGIVLESEASGTVHAGGPVTDTSLSEPSKRKKKRPEPEPMEQPQPQPEPELRFLTLGIVPQSEASGTVHAGGPVTDTSVA